MQFSSSLYQIRSWLEPQLGKYRIPDIVMLNRSTPRAPTWRPTRGPTRGRSRTAAAGRAVSGSLPGQTSWQDTTGNTREWSLSSVTSVIGLSPGVTTSVCIWRDTDNQEVIFNHQLYLMLSEALKPCCCVSLRLWYGLIYSGECHQHVTSPLLLSEIKLKPSKYRVYVDRCWYSCLGVLEDHVHVHTGLQI